MKKLYAVHFEKDGRECAFGWTEDRKSEEIVAQRITGISGVSNVRVEIRRANFVIWSAQVNGWSVRKAENGEYLGQIYACGDGYRFIYHNEDGFLVSKTYDTLADARYFAERFKL